MGKDLELTERVEAAAESIVSNENDVWALKSILTERVIREATEDEVKRSEQAEAADPMSGGAILINDEWCYVQRMSKASLVRETSYMTGRKARHR
jgi:hypothetical protein